MRAGRRDAGTGGEWYDVESAHALYKEGCGEVPPASMLFLDSML